MSKPQTKSENTEPAAPTRRPVVTLLAAVLGLVVAAQVALFALHAWRFTTFPFQLDYGEGPILQIALRFAQGESLYPPLNQGYPYVIASYVPLYYVVCGLAAKLTGPSFLGGRLISVLSALALALCCGLVVWDHTKRRFPAFLAGGMVLALPIIMVWSALMRTDMLALALSLAGFWLFQRGRRTTGIVLFALAVMTRWTNVASIAAALAGLLLQRKWKPALLWGAAQAVLILLLVFGANAATHGGMFDQLRLHTSSSLGKSWTWGQVGLLFSVATGEWPVYFVLGALGAIWCAVRPPHRVIASYFALSWAIFFTSGRIGSTFNYLMEPLAVGAIAIGIMWAELAALDLPKVSARYQSLARTVTLATLGGMSGALALQMVASDLNLTYGISLLRSKADGNSSAYVLQRIREAPGPTLCEDVGLQIQAGREVPLDPFEFTQLAHKGAFDPSHVYADVRAGKFPLIVLRFNPEKTGPDKDTGDWAAGRWPDGIISAVRERYVLAEEREPYLLYVPGGIGNRAQVGRRISSGAGVKTEREGDETGHGGPPRTSGLAKVVRAGAIGVSRYRHIPEERDVRSHLSATPSSDVYPSQHSRRTLPPQPR